MHQRQSSAYNYRHKQLTQKLYTPYHKYCVYFCVVGRVISIEFCVYALLLRYVILFCSGFVSFHIMIIAVRYCFTTGRIDLFRVCSIFQHVCCVVLKRERARETTRFYCTFIISRTAELTFVHSSPDITITHMNSWFLHYL